MDPNTRLRIATRIHFALLRHLGKGVDIGAMLRDDAESREVLWVCQACGDPELKTLARQYERARSLPAQQPGGHAPQATPWSGNTTGFGLTQPPPAGDTVGTSAEGHAAGWFNPARWRRSLRGKG